MKHLMLRVLTLALLCTLCLCAFACSKDENAPPDGMFDAAAEDATYNLYVPDGWIAQSSGPVSSAYVEDYNKETGVVGRSNISMTLCYPDDPYVTPADYWNTELKPKYESAELGHKDFALVTDAADVQLGGLDGKRFEFTFQTGDVAYKQMQVVVNNGKWVYLFTYTARAEFYDLHTTAEEGETSAVDLILSKFRY